MFHATSLLWLTAIGLVIIKTSKAAMVPGLNEVINFGGRGLLEARQTGTGTSSTPQPPPQCVTNCTSVTNVLDAGCTVATCCTANFVNSFFSCFTCVGQVENMTDYTSIQQTLDSFTEECAADGVTSLPKLTFPGQNPNRPLSGIPSSAAGSSTLAPGLPISTGPAGTTTGQSTVAQSTITAISSTPAAPESTISSGSSSVTTAPPSTTTSSGTRTLPTQYTNIVLIASTVLTGLSFYLVL